MMGLLKKVSQGETLQNAKKIFRILQAGQINAWCIVGSVLLSVCYAVLTMYAVLLLFPLAGGIVSGDFSRVEHMPGLNWILVHFPDAFAGPTRHFLLLVGWFYLVTVLKNAFYYASFLLTHVQAKRTTANLRLLLVEKCLSFSKEFYDKNTIAYLQPILSKAPATVESYFRIFQNVITHFFVVVAYLGVMMVISWRLTLLAAIVFPLVAFVTQLLTRKIREASVEHSRLAVSLNERIFNMLYCMPVIKSFAKEKEEYGAFACSSNEEITQSFRAQRLTSLATPVEDIGVTTGVLVIAIGLGVTMHTSYAVQASQAIVFFYLAMKLSQGLNAFNHFRLGVNTSVSSVHEIERILDHGEAAVVPGGAERFTGLGEGIHFKGLSFSYGEQGHRALDGVTFSVEKRSIVAIVGPSGSGKSTLINLLLRFYDCPPGTIFLDGRDIRDYDIATIREHMALVSQEVLLFNDTIRNNILYGADADVSDEYLQEFGGKVQIRDFVEKMPNKYDTKVGDRGGRLSGGERQRLSIARAIMKDPEILIMDEATSALDSRTEAKINEYLLSFAKEKTLIIIAHRLSTIKRADKIVYLEKGQVLESGTLQELIDKKGAFYKQWEAQKI